MFLILWAINFVTYEGKEVDIVSSILKSVSQDSYLLLHGREYVLEFLDVGVTIGPEGLG